MTIGNLRGVKESAKMFAIPTYIFIIAMLILIVTGLVKVYVFGEVPQSVYPVPEAVGDMTFFLMIRAFAAGCFGLTGVEAVPNYEVTVLSQIASQVFGNGIWFYILQISTAVILKIKGCHGFSWHPFLVGIRQFLVLAVIYPCIASRIERTLLRYFRGVVWR